MPLNSLATESGALKNTEKLARLNFKEGGTAERWTAKPRRHAYAPSAVHQRRLDLKSRSLHAEAHIGISQPSQCWPVKDVTRAYTVDGDLHSQQRGVTYLAVAVMRHSSDSAICIASQIRLN